MTLNLRRGLPAVLACLIIALPLVSCGPPDNTPLVGNILSGVVNDINAAVNNTAATGNATLIAAMNQAEAAAYDVINELNADLGKNIDKVNTDVQNDIQLLQQLATEVQAGASAIISQITTSIQQVLNDLPLTNKNPQITSYTPHYTVPGRSVVLDAAGNFATAYQEHQHPSLVYQGHTYKASELLSQEIGFTLPGSIFANSTNQIESLSFPINVAYQTGSIFKSLHPGQFVLRIEVLPPLPTQSLTITSPQTVTGVITRTNTSPLGAANGGPVFSANSFDCNTHDVTGTAPPDPGFKITSAAPIITWERNSYNVHLISQSVGADAAAFEYETEPDCTFGISHGSGEVSFYISFTESMTTTTTKSVPTPINLPWGSQVSPNVTPGWSVNATLFNGSVLDCTDTCQDQNDILQITNHNNTTVTIQSIVPSG